MAGFANIKAVQPQQVLDLIESLIRSGNSVEAQKRLRRSHLTEINELEPKSRARWAQLARRAGLPLLTIKVLHPFVRGREAEVRPPHDAEVLEYAAALSFVGLEEEASLLLNALSGSGLRDLYLAFALFPQWRYQEAKTPLRRFLQSESDAYQRSIAEINLASVHVFLGEQEEAEPMLLGLIGKAEANGQILLWGNGCELLAQVALQRRRFDEAQMYLERSQILFQQVKSLDAVLVAKWQALLHLEQNPNDDSTFLRVADLLRERQNFEALREMTLHKAAVLQDRNLARTLRLGTPYLGFFESPQGRLVLGLVDRDQSHLDFSSGSITASGSCVVHEPPSSIDPDLPDKGLESATLRVLFSDFFKPFSVYRLWQETAPNRYFDPLSSPTLIHQKVMRLRRWLKARNSPLEVLCQQSRFALGFRVTTRFTRFAETRAGPASSVDQLVQIMKARSHWRIGDLIEVTAWPERTLQRYLSLAIDQKKIVRHGHARATYYMLFWK